ncbi:hypothetical protein HDV02_003002 [Globomyces sp. JEL0801]|nr:hypothetical protein HDV02_003002 [Globomyces sp. JEL0801]
MDSTRQESVRTMLEPEKGSKSTESPQQPTTSKPEAPGLPPPTKHLSTLKPTGKASAPSASPPLSDAAGQNPSKASPPGKSTTTKKKSTSPNTSVTSTSKKQRVNPLLGEGSSGKKKSITSAAEEGADIKGKKISKSILHPTKKRSGTEIQEPSKKKRIQKETQNKSKKGKEKAVSEDEGNESQTDNLKPDNEKKHKPFHIEVWLDEVITDDIPENFVNSRPLDIDYAEDLKQEILANPNRAANPIIVVLREDIDFERFRDNEGYRNGFKHQKIYYVLNGQHRMYCLQSFDPDNQYWDGLVYTPKADEIFTLLNLGLNHSLKQRSATLLERFTKLRLLKHFTGKELEIGKLMGIKVTKKTKKDGTEAAMINTINQLNKASRYPRDAALIYKKTEKTQIFTEEELGKLEPLVHKFQRECSRTYQIPAVASDALKTQTSTHWYTMSTTRLTYNIARQFYETCYKYITEGVPPEMKDSLDTIRKGKNSKHEPTYNPVWEKVEYASLYWFSRLLELSIYSKLYWGYEKKYLENDDLFKYKYNAHGEVILDPNPPHLPLPFSFDEFVALMDEKAFGNNKVMALNTMMNGWTRIQRNMSDFNRDVMKIRKDIFNLLFMTTVEDEPETESIPGYTDHGFNYFRENDKCNVSYYPGTCIFEMAKVFAERDVKFPFVHMDIPLFYYNKKIDTLAFADPDCENETEFIRHVLDLFVAVSEDDAVGLIWCSEQQILLFHDWAEKFPDLKIHIVYVSETNAQYRVFHSKNQIYRQQLYVPTRNMQFVVYIVKGEPDWITQQIRNSYDAEERKDYGHNSINPFNKPEGFLMRLFGMMGKKGFKMLDCFSGTCSSLIPAMAHYIG